ncbi:hypothetical protein GCM10007897_24260 [Sphingobium jiangsuense]|uniref:Uncharacterized protein n=1 Tax=Sphingobium jiangsuense TaxID=870476 RepID=A0A7W6BVF6_9SPHN|nr:hypothetical protein [Sphingobium jiangsuense]MBB3928599.1 hypothetical protein [Sphingobium jiangsuense]GLT01035.1 hypothetical protein GCM10007897_24260 [Sphingobium jiangsuense]
MTYKTADNRTVPEPVLRQIHQYSFYKTSENRQVTLAVLEIRQPTLATLSLVEVTDGYEIFAAEYLTGILAMRLAEGWILNSASERHYVLAVPSLDESPSAAMPICARCGSNRIVRDACARWNSATGRWALADVHDCAFCEACESEGDDLVRLVSGEETPAVRTAEPDQ